MLVSVTPNETVHTHSLQQLTYVNVHGNPFVSLNPGSNAWDLVIVEGNLKPPSLQEHTAITYKVTLIVFIKRVDKGRITSSVSPLSERIEELWVLLAFMYVEEPLMKMG